VILVTGFEPFGAHTVNPSEGLAKAMDGRRFGACETRGAVLPVHHADAATRLAALLTETDPVAVVHLGLAAGRARVALERVAVNVMDYDEPDRTGFQASGEPIAPGGPTRTLRRSRSSPSSRHSPPRGSPRTSRTRRAPTSATRRSTRRSTPCGTSRTRRR